MKIKPSLNKKSGLSGTINDLPQWISEYTRLNIQVKIIRESMGISQKKLADNIGLTWRSIPNIESGKVNPKISTLQKIADYLDCEMKILLIPRESLSTQEDEKGPREKDVDISLQKKLTFNTETHDKVEKDNDDVTEKKKEYFWD